MDLDLIRGLLFAPAFTLWGAPATWLELVAFGLALAMVACNIREIHWGWPLAAISSVLYCALFWRSKLYGDAALQVFFALVALWGWAQWLRGRRDDGGALTVSQLSRRGLLASLATGALLWPATGWFLKTWTDTDVPWWDAFPTAVSVIGTGGSTDLMTRPGIWSPRNANSSLTTSTFSMR